MEYSWKMTGSTGHHKFWHFFTSFEPGFDNDFMGFHGKIINGETTDTGHDGHGGFHRTLPMAGWF